MIDGREAQMLVRALFGFAALFLVCFTGANAASIDRYALIIGNGDYERLGKLENPSNDARLMQKALESVGFSTVVALDADRLTFDRVVKEFAAKISGTSDAVVYYAGHGIQHGAENFLLPTDSHLSSAKDLPQQAVSLTTITDQISAAGPRAAVVILDSCRNNPLAAILKGNGSNLPNGLAKITGNLGTFIAYATAPGRVALDGSGKDSPFTQALAYYVTKPGLPIEQVFKRVRERVVDETEGEQVPWDNSSLINDFFFKEALGDQFELAKVSDADVAAWKVAALDDGIDAYRHYLAAFPKGLFSDLAAAKIRTYDERLNDAGATRVGSVENDPGAELAAWNKALASGKARDFRAYLTSYPNGFFRRDAAALLASAPPGEPEEILPITTKLTPDFREFAENPLYPEINECDHLAGHVQEASDPAVGVHFGEIEPERAIPVCAAALEKYPTSLRIMMNYARAIDASGRHDEARALYRVGVEAGFPIAFRSLGDVYRDGRGVGVEQNYDEARYWYVLGADKHNVFAQYNLARFYEKGLGVTVDQRKAAYWYWRAARQGFAPAMERLARYYLKGDVLAKDEAQGAILMQGAAEMGHMWSEYGYAELLVKGRGVKADANLARVWMQRSAQQGYNWAAAKLGLYFRDGIGGKKDNIAALEWLLIAEKSDLKKYEKDRRDLQRQMSRRDVRRAEAFAADFEPKRIR